MPGSDHKTINIKGLANKHEYAAAVPLTVGMVVQRNGVGKLALSAVASATYAGGEYMVAEAPERGKGIYGSGTTESTYQAEELTPVFRPHAAMKCWCCSRRRRRLPMAGCSKSRPRAKSLRRRASIRRPFGPKKH